MAGAFDKANRLPGTPTLIPFGDKRALFFCCSPLEATKVVPQERYIHKE